MNVSAKDCGLILINKNGIAVKGEKNGLRNILKGLCSGLDFRVSTN
jgi:hypothetical protein